jgi:hypothetical protein
VVDVGIKYIRCKDEGHLIISLQQDYSIIKDWEGNRYMVLTLDWNKKTKRSTHFYATLCCKSLQMIQPHDPTNHKINLTCSPKIWPENPICTRARQSLPLITAPSTISAE